MITRHTNRCDDFIYQPACFWAQARSLHYLKLAVKSLKRFFKTRSALTLTNNPLALGTRKQSITARQPCQIHHPFIPTQFILISASPPRLVSTPKPQRCSIQLNSHAIKQWLPLHPQRLITNSL